MTSFKQYLIEQEEDYQYNLFLETLEVYNNGMYEGIFEVPNALKKGWDFIKSLATSAHLKFKDIAEVFKNKKLFGFFSKIGWSFKKLAQIVAKGYGYWKQLIHVVGSFVEKVPGFKVSEKYIKQLQEYLEKHPIVKRVGGLVLAGLLIYIWTSAISFTGDTDFDFDQTMLFNALTGNYNLVDLLTGPDGAKFLTYIATGVLGNWSFPWPGTTPILFAGSLVYTVARNEEVRKKVKDFMMKVTPNKKWGG
jgi:hypothetical protein